MTEFPYTIRNYRTADFNNFVLLYLEAEQQEPIGRPATPQAINEKLSRPGYTPEKDLFVVETVGEIIGFMDIVPESGIKRVIADGWLLPEHRRKGLGRRLLDFARRRASELGAGFVYIIIRNDNVAAKNILYKLGFKYARRFLEIALDLTGLEQQELSRAAEGCRRLQEGEEGILVEIQNRSFAEHWGYHPNTVESINYRINLSHRSPGDIVLLYEEGKVAGYCWTEITPRGRGQIYMLGTDPDCRSQGIGRKTLLAGLARLKSKGINEVFLMVDSENKVACSLYESIGFKARTSYLWYEKAVG
jgi:mycothiol synthase